MEYLAGWHVNGARVPAKSVPKTVVGLKVIFEWKTPLSMKGLIFGQMVEIFKIKWAAILVVSANSNWKM